MNITLLFKKIFSNKPTVAFLVAVVNFVLVYPLFKDEIGPYRGMEPVQADFLKWEKEFPGRIDVQYNTYHGNRKIFYEVDFKGTPDEQLRLTDDEVQKYLATLPVKEITFENVDMPAASVVALLDNPKIETMTFNYGDRVRLCFPPYAQGYKLRFKEYLLKNLEDPKEDFSTFIDANNESGKRLPQFFD